MMENEKRIKRRKKQTERKRKRKTFLILIFILIMLLLLLFKCSGKDENSPTEYEQNVNEITEIDYSKQQEALNTIVEEGKMNVNYSSKAVFEGSVSEIFNIKNIKNNHYPIVFELYDETGNCIYTSKMLEPGYEMNSIELEKTLSAGVHECKLRVGYVEDGNVSSIFPITIEVK